MIEWNYAGEADITIGEVHISKTSKIILILLIIGIIAICGLAIYFRAYIYDYIANPSIVLTEKEVNIEVNSSFNPEEFIANDTSGYIYEIIGSDIDTSKLGTYTVTFNSKNRVKSNSIDLVVNIVDTTAPEITLIKDMDLLVRGKDTDNFNPKKYLKTVKDNYSDFDDIKIEYTTDIDFTKDTVQIIFTATDKAGNIGNKTLNLAIFDSREDLEFEQQKQQEEQEQSNDDGSNNNNPTTTQHPTTEQPSQPTTPTTEAPPPSQPTGRSISGVHNVTKSWADTSWTTTSVMFELQSGVGCTGDSVYLDMSGGQITGPGTYTYYWKYSSDGAVAASCSFIVTE